MHIVADSSPLIAFAVLGQLQLLEQIFSFIFLPPAVFYEITKPHKPYARDLHQFAQGKIKSVQNLIAIQTLSQVVDLGEAEAIVLALENGIPDLLIDDAKGRRVARLNGLSPVGTVGVLLRAKQVGYINEVKSSLDTLVANKIRISQPLYDQALELAAEN